jgi:hypothetical protein
LIFFFMPPWWSDHATYDQKVEADFPAMQPLFSRWKDGAVGPLC